MNRRTDSLRDIKSPSNILYASQEQKADIESNNLILQFYEIEKIITDLGNGNKFQLRPSTLLLFNRITIQKIYTCAGNYRTIPTVALPILRTERLSICLESLSMIGFNSLWTA